MKKILLITGLVIIAAAAIVFGIYLRRRQPAAAPAAESPAGPSAGLPIASPSTGIGTSGGTGSLLPTTGTQITSAAAVDFAVLPGNITRYVDLQGEVIQMTPASSTALSALKIPDLLDAKFSYDGKKVLFKSGTAAAPRWRVYDADKNIWRELLLGARDAAWAPADYRIAYAAAGLSSTAVYTQDLGPKNSAPQKRLTLNAEDLTVGWAGSGALLLGERPSSVLTGTVWKYSLSQGGLSVLSANIAGAETLWGQNYGLLFAARAGGRGGNLYLLDKSGATIQTFSFLTLPDKCAFFTATSSAEKIVCAVPQNTQIFGGASLPDDYERGIWNTADNLYVVDPAGGGVTLLNLPSGITPDAARLRVSGGSVYFLNRADRKIYSAALGG